AVWAVEWSAKGTDDRNNCEFIDESDFNLNMTREKAWSRHGNFKIRRVTGATKIKAPGDRSNVPKGTTEGHFMDRMDIMNQFPEM
ncbi:hypothetical protein BDF21DRAFT_323971, partial [Thamnidium elegans]